MELRHVVVTSVDRDDVPDKGAGHFAATIRAIKAKLPQASVEVLTPDFLGVEEERSEPCSPRARRSSTTTSKPSAACTGACAARRRATTRHSGCCSGERARLRYSTKSGIIVGLGETNDEIVETMRDLRGHGVDVVTIGQYLQPSGKHAAIDRWVHPDEFRWLREQGEALGRLRLRRPARPLELPRGRAAPRRGDRAWRCRPY